VTATTGKTPLSSGAPEDEANEEAAADGVFADPRSPSFSAMPVSADINERYGRTARNATRNRRWAIGSAAAFAAVLLAWVVWGGDFGNLGSVEAQNIGHTVLSDNEVEVTFQLTLEPDTDSACALEALNSNFAIVGWKIVDVPGTSERTRSITETVRTSELSVTGLIYRCWLT
jgi:hypothetical protein